MLFFVAALTVCASGPRDNCVHDGDTVWLEGEKIRIADIDTPELNGMACASMSDDWRCAPGAGWCSY